MKALVSVTADDFGATPYRDRELVRLVTSGAVQQLSAIANPEYLELTQIFESLRGTTRPFTVALHFNLSDGLPLSASLRVARSLGLFFGKQSLYTSLAAAASSEHEVSTALRTFILEELKAQLTALRSASPRPVTHIDGHHHVLAHPFVASVVAPALPELGIVSIRIPFDPPSNDLPSPWADDAVPLCGLGGRIPRAFSGAHFAQCVSQWAAESALAYQGQGLKRSSAFCGLWTMSHGPLEGSCEVGHCSARVASSPANGMCTAWRLAISGAVKRALEVPAGACGKGTPTVEVMSHPGGRATVTDLNLLQDLPTEIDGVVVKRWHISDFHRDTGREREANWICSQLPKILAWEGAKAGSIF